MNASITGLDGVSGVMVAVCSFNTIHRISVHAVPVKNVRKATHPPDSEPVPSQVPQVTEPYIFIEIYLQILSLRAVILFLVEWDLDSGSAADVVGITKRARPYPTEPSEMPRPCCSCFAIFTKWII